MFRGTSKAEFKWKETDTLDGAAMQVFSYRVEVKNSQFSVTALPALPTFVGFHGLVYIDEATRGTRRISMEAEGIPLSSPVHASALTIDYDYVGINDHDYLMPVQGEMRMKAGKREGFCTASSFGTITDLARIRGSSVLTFKAAAHRMRRLPPIYGEAAKWMRDLAHGARGL